jgi:hypothetical protein
LRDETPRPRIDDAESTQCEERHRLNALASIFSLRRQRPKQPFEQGADDRQGGYAYILVGQMILSDRRPDAHFQLCGDGATEIQT